MIDNTVNDPIYLTMNRMLKSERNGIIKQYAEYLDKKYSKKVKPSKGGWTQLNGKGYGDLDGAQPPCRTNFFKLMIPLSIFTILQ